MQTRSLNILVVDDNAAHLEVLRRKLLKISDLQPAVTLCQTAEKARALLRKSPIDCMLLDYQLGTISGLEFLRSLRQAGFDVPVIMLTSHGNEEMAVESIKGGAHDFLSKDNTPPHVLRHAILDATATVELHRKLAANRRELERFASVASHDLKSPVRTMTMLARLVLRDAAGSLDSENRQRITQIERSGARMLNLIDALVAYTRVGKRERNHAAVDLGSVVESVLSDLRCEEGLAKIEVGPLPTVVGDEILLAQLLQNLISNGIKYRRETPAAIKIDASPEGDEWTITVADNGIGIETQAHEEIFTAFRRLHSDARIEGTGLGLATCKKIVDLHGGRIWVDSRVGEGSRFHFTLPAAKQDDGSGLARERIGEREEGQPQDFNAR